MAVEPDGPSNVVLSEGAARERIVAEATDGLWVLTAAMASEAAGQWRGREERWAVEGEWRTGWLGIGAEEAEGRQRAVAEGMAEGRRVAEGRVEAARRVYEAETEATARAFERQRAFEERLVALVAAEGSGRSSVLLEEGGAAVGVAVQWMGSVSPAGAVGHDAALAQQVAGQRAMLESVLAALQQKEGEVRELQEEVLRLEGQLGQPGAVTPFL